MPHTDESIVVGHCRLLLDESDSCKGMAIVELVVVLILRSLVGAGISIVGVECSDAFMRLSEVLAFKGEGKWRNPEEWKVNTS